MPSERILPPDPLAFIEECILARRLHWTYHVAMRLERRSISRAMVIDAAGRYEMIEAYPDDKYLPSYLLFADLNGAIFHVLFAADVPEANVRVVTAYYPDPKEWSADLKRRLKP